ncbi:PAS domain S-box protein [Haladaptatus sp. NG-SE-30]
MDERTIRVVLDTLPDVFYVFDATGSLVQWNDRLKRITGYDDEELAGMSPFEFVPEEDSETIASAIEAVLAGDRIETRQSALVTKDGDRVPYEFNARRTVDENGEVSGFVGTGRNITERRKRERELRRERDRTRQVLETSPIGILILDSQGQFIDANDRAGGILGLPEQEITERTYDDARWNATDEDGNSISSDELPFARAMATGEPLYDSIISVERPDGIRIWLSVNTAPVFDSEDEVAEVVASIADITDRRERERELRQQRDELETLNRINELVREVIRELVAAASREEIEETVCNYLADSDLYRFAWVSEYDIVEDGLVARAKAGDDEGFQELIGEMAAGDWERPATTVLETGEHLVVRDISESSVFPERLRVEGSQRGLHSGIAVPLSYGQTTYGVLVVYATRPDAFTEREAAGFEALGELVGFVIDAVESKRLLHADRVVELEFRVTNDASFLVSLSRQFDATCILEELIPAQSGTLLEYVRVEGVPTQMVLHHAEQSDAIGHIRALGNSLFEITIIESSPILSLIDHGASIRNATAERGEARIIADVPPDADVRSTAEALAAAFPTTELVGKRDRGRPVRTVEESWVELENDLTERQLAALRTAYVAGYFEWPRESTAEDVAEALGVTPATLHQHVRKAEQKLLTAFFD